MPRFGLRRDEIEEALGLASLRARQSQAGWQLSSARNPHDLSQAENTLAGINAQIAMLEGLTEVIELNNQRILEDLQRLLGVTSRPAGVAPPRVISTGQASTPGVPTDGTG